MRRTIIPQARATGLAPGIAIGMVAAGLIAAGGALVPAAAQSTADGRALVQEMCAACHRPGLIENSSGYDQAGWEELVLTMIDLSGTPELEAIGGYLAQTYPPTARRAPTLVAGDLKIAFEEWVAPTAGQRSRDPAEALDGSIWWTGQWADLIGRVDPDSGALQEFPLPANARAHTVFADPDGRIWYTGNGNGTMGRLDPQTGAVTEYPMPDPAAGDPHSAVIDADGIVWFTVQRGNRIGRLDPESGAIDLVIAPTPGSRPYGIKLNSQGVPWVAANGSNRLYRIDPETLEIEQHELPDPATTVRRLAFASDDTIWYVNSARGRLGHYDPATRQAREWESPSGPGSHPYAIAVIDDVVWYNESGQRPDALVRFDPAGETFQSWAIPSGGIHAGIVRHMRPTRDGALLIHQSSTNRILRVSLPPAG